ncbi:hypothetical protein ISN45_Aa05g017990 [Arabidopsis thaliana x Arabidopsis arenosa]|uniref:Uncharacterized protein n=1 Tax=Arabidopsis thaliana x Arabidopsis arenosa TaxID=1240361 RepID=A0A8T1ZNG8_9BRAS|nr:hypothetical protein ISN45_Aa05g017990 [Arabidopsis thaliana x Arabidopsis arenosa]
MSSQETRLPLSASPQVSSSLTNRGELDIDMPSNIDNEIVVPTLLPLPPPSPYPLSSKRLGRSSSLVKSSCIMKWKKMGKRREEEEDDDPFLIALRKCSNDTKIDNGKVVSKRKNSLKFLVSCKAPSVKE